MLEMQKWTLDTNVSMRITQILKYHDSNSSVQVLKTISITSLRFIPCDNDIFATFPPDLAAQSL